MKTVLLIATFLFSCSVLSQSASERELIKKSTSPAAQKALIEKQELDKQVYKLKLAKYLSTCGANCPIPNKFIDDTPIFYTTDNAGSSKTMRANSMYPGGSLGLSVTGSGMVAGVWDGGKVRNTHNELSGKITISDGGTTLSNHATHVTGTICAAGIKPAAKGIAYGATAKTYDWDNDGTEMGTFAADGYLVSNHSYGYVASTLDTWRFGAYDSSSAEIDNLSNTYPYYQIVHAAGNDRDDPALNQASAKIGFDLLTGTTVAKNVLTVAAVEQVNSYIDNTSVLMSSFSNWGPTDDGRIKPDISAKGVGVYSCISTSNTLYDTYQGTSMACPAITGLIVLLQKHYNNINADQYMKAAMVRGLLCHTAREAGDNPGPDYSFGWGLADGQTAAKLISTASTSSILEMQTLNNQAIYTRNFTVDNAQNLKISICWTDPTGLQNAAVADNRVARLKNNLDLKIFKDGQIFYPWRLDADNYTSPATNDSDNNVDNIEVIEISNADPGVYTIQVTHKGNLTNGHQDFALIGSAGTGLNLSSSHFELDKEFFVFPNPSKGSFNFKSQSNLNIDRIEITDLSGKVVTSFTSFEDQHFDISNLQSGVYFAKFISAEATITRKILKE
ncbi:MAG: hypothetical protein CFE24_10705 [Flavobacterium sp. BFFFF2]|nr:MAG: hypothetical protein CFE24_10705 [Flavobacterium sp. BFFFF2]